MCVCVFVCVRLCDLSNVSCSFTDRIFSFASRRWRVPSQFPPWKECLTEEPFLEPFLMEICGTVCLFCWSSRAWPWAREELRVADRWNYSGCGYGPLTLGLPWWLWVSPRSCSSLSLDRMWVLMASSVRSIQLCWRRICLCSSCHWWNIMWSMSRSPVHTERHTVTLIHTL